MGIFDGWPFKSREQTEREQRDFEKRVFPFGEAQRAAAAALLNSLIVGRKMTESDKMFAFILAKDRYELDEHTFEALEAAREQLRKMRWMQPGEIDLLLALVRLDSAVENMGQYPTEDEVRRAAGLLAQE